jgi:hypothetical protein
MAFRPQHVERSGSLAVAAPLRRAFLYFTPEGERGWVPGWRPQYLHPEDGTLAAGLVFRTDADGEQTFWVVSWCDPAQGEAEYVRLTPGSRLGTVTIRCDALSASATRVRVTYQLTSLSEVGNTTLDAFTPEAFGDMLARWEQAIQRLTAGA